MKGKVLVTGATGTVGREVVRTLVAWGHPVRVLARNPAGAASAFGREVEIAAGDFGDRASLVAALSGIESASIATSPTPTLDQQEIGLMDAARAASVRRLVKLSAFGIDFAADRIHRAHGTSEQRLRASGIPHVVVRPVVFMSNMFMELASIRSGTLPSGFADGRITFVDPRDVGEVIAHALVDSAHEGRHGSSAGRRSCRTTTLPPRSRASSVGASNIGVSIGALSKRTLWRQGCRTSSSRH